jgi:hypothetical protein
VTSPAPRIWRGFQIQRSTEVEAAAIEEVGVVGGSAAVRRGGGGTSSAVGGWRAGSEMTVS